MPKVYHPVRCIYVKASKPHPEDTEYLVSFGLEYWGGKEPVHVIKVQMVYGGAVSGRRSPSYPSGTDDLDRVMKALAEIKKGGGEPGRGKINPL
ncbi:hypothetical protein L2D14_06510 [Thalassospiraceae bacterium LMO-JJ14]|nr:hypothetical protein L2D14_06510 [Thalassospiraceae bacterium LMO-JJ14]